MRAGHDWRQRCLDLPCPRLTDVEVARLASESRKELAPALLPNRAVEPWVERAMQLAYLAGFDAGCPF